MAGSYTSPNPAYSAGPAASGTPTRCAHPRSSNHYPAPSAGTDHNHQCPPHLTTIAGTNRASGRTHHPKPQPSHRQDLQSPIPTTSRHRFDVRHGALRRYVRSAGTVCTAVDDPWRGQPCGQGSSAASTHRGVRRIGHVPGELSSGQSLLFWLILLPLHPASTALDDGDDSDECGDQARPVSTDPVPQ